MTVENRELKSKNTPVNVNLIYEQNPQLADKMSKEQFLRKYEEVCKTVEAISKLNFALVLDKTLKVSLGQPGEKSSFDPKQIAIKLDPIEIIEKNYNSDQILWIVAKFSEDFTNRFGSYKSRTQENIRAVEEKIKQSEQVRKNKQAELKIFIENLKKQFPETSLNEKIFINDLVTNAITNLDETISEIQSNISIEGKIPRIKAQKPLKNMYLTGLPADLQNYPLHMQFLHAIQMLSVGIELNNIPISRELQEVLNVQVKGKNQFNNPIDIPLVNLIMNSLLNNSSKNRLEMYQSLSSIRNLFSDLITRDVVRALAPVINTPTPEEDDKQTGAGASSGQSSDKNNSAKSHENSTESRQSLPSNSNNSQSNKDQSQKPSNQQSAQDQNQSVEMQNENKEKSDQSSTTKSQKGENQTPQGQDGGGSLRDKDQYSDDDKKHTGDINDTIQTDTERFGGEEKQEEIADQYGQSGQFDETEAQNPKAKEEKNEKHASATQTKPEKKSSADSNSSQNESETNAKSNSQQKEINTGEKNAAGKYLSEMTELSKIYATNRLNLFSTSIQEMLLNSETDNEVLNNLRYNPDQYELLKQSLQQVQKPNPENDDDDDYYYNNKSSAFNGRGTNFIENWFKENIANIDRQAKSIAESWAEIIGKDTKIQSMQRQGPNAKSGRLEMRAVVKNYPQILSKNFDDLTLHSRRVPNFEHSAPKEININFLFDTSGSMAGNLAELLVVVMTMYRSGEFFYQMKKNYTKLKENPTKLNLHFYSYNQNSRYMGTFLPEDFENPAKARQKFIQEVFGQLRIMTGNKPAGAYKHILDILNNQHEQSDGENQTSFGKGPCIRTRLKSPNSYSQIS